MVQKGEGYAQGMFMKYLVCDDDNGTTNKREFGFGSTNKRKKEK